MKVIIAGSRPKYMPLGLDSFSLVDQVVVKTGWLPFIDMVVSGRAPGIDLAGEGWAREHNIPVKTFEAKWEDLSDPNAIIKKRPDGTLYDAAAGFRRNLQMAEFGDALILIHTGKSPGSLDMLRKAYDQQRIREFKIHNHIIK